MNAGTFTNIMRDNTPLEYIENIIESMDQSIAVIDKNEQVVIWNSRMTHDFFDKTEVLQKRLRDIFPSFWQEYRGIVWGDILMHEVLRKGQHHNLARFPLQTKEAKIRYFDLKASPLKNNSGEILGIILILNDITDNIFMENQLLRHARTTSLANLGASIAHEIRNPLNSISLNIQLVKEWLANPDSSTSPEVIPTLDNVLNEIRRLNELIRYFLRFSKPPEPQLTLDDPNQAVEQALRLLMEQARKEHVEITRNLGKLPNIMMDRNQLSQSIYNICLNGIQALQQQGGGKLEITTLDHIGYVIIEIKDNGLGLSEEAQQNLFNLFFTTKEDGSGLGLAIANQIIERHDGRIVAENNLDRGACFSIYLPVTPATAG